MCAGIRAVPWIETEEHKYHLLQASQSVRVFQWYMAVCAYVWIVETDCSNHMLTHCAKGSLRIHL